MSVELQRSIPELPSRYRGPAFRAACDVLMEDPVLVRWVRTWRARTGAANELAPVGDSELPLVALSPVSVGSQTEGVDFQRANFTISVQLFVEGTCFEDIVALWEAVEDAIQDDKPFRDTTVKDYLCGLFRAPDGSARGVMRLRPVAPAFDPVDLNRIQKKLTMQSGTGGLTCFFLRPTRVDPSTL